MPAAHAETSRLRRAIWMALGVFVCVAILSGLGRLRGTENMLLGVRFEIRATQPTTDDVLLLTLEKPLSTDGGAVTWPLDRLADLVTRLDQAGAVIIGLDISGMPSSFAQTETDGADELAEAMRVHGRVVLPMNLAASGDPLLSRAGEIAQYACGPGELLRPESLDPGLLALPPAVLIEAAAGIGANNVFPDTDAVVREAPLAVSWNGTVYPAFWTELVRLSDDLPAGSLRVGDGVARLGERVWPVTPSAEALINYRGGYQDFPRLPYHMAFEMTTDQLRAAVEGRIVIVGADLAPLTGYLRTPLAPRIPGVEVAAHVTDNLLGDDLLSRPCSSPWVKYLATLAMALLTAWLVARTGPFSGLLMTGLLLAAVMVVGVGLFIMSVYVPMAEMLLTVGLTGALIVANSAATVDRERVEAETRMRSRLQTIAGIGRLTNSNLDRDQLLVETLRWAEGEIGAEACSLLLMDEGDRHLRFEVALGEKGPMLKDFRVEVGKGIAGTVALTGEPVIVDDVLSDPRWTTDIADAIEFNTRSILCVPMTLQDRVVGVIELINKREGTFTDQDVQLLTVIAHQAALFLETARLYRELSDRVDFANAELRDAHRRLALEMARISTLVDQMTDGVIATDASDRVVIFNNAASKMLSIDGDQALGNPVLAVVDSPELSSLFAMPLSPLGGSYETEIILDEETGRTILAHIALIERPEEQAADKCAVFTDITHFKQLDQMKMDLISFVSHELKNPIASLQGACHMLTERVNTDDEKTLHLLHIARRQGRRMQYLVQDFLDLSRIEAGLRLDLSWMGIDDPEQLIENVFEMCRQRGAGHTRTIEVAEDLGVFWADRPKIESVMINLIDNAHKYSPEGGTIAVRLFRREGEVIIEVQDEGVGIKPEDVGRLFHSFQRVNDDSYGRVSGTGVGLYVCKHIMEAHGGGIEVDSVWGEGSTFRAHFPHFTAAPGEDGGPPPRGA